MNEQDQAPIADAALLIDWENIKFSLDARGLRPSVAAIRDACARFGRIVLARAYGDWQDHWLRQDPRDLYAVGIEPVYVPTRRYEESDGSSTIKNSVDVRLASDCIELIHTHPGIGVFILATGDSDFIHVVNKLRPYGKRVVGLAVSWSASPRLADTVDELVLYDRDIEPPIDELPVEPSPAAEVTGPAIPLAARTVAVAEGLSEENAARVIDAIARILNLYRDADRPLNISSLGLELRNALGDHDFRMLVRGRLQRVVREMARLGMLRMDQRGVDDWLYRVDEEVAPPPSVAQELPPRRYAARLQWDDIDRDLRRRAIQAVVALEQDPRLDWLVFNRLAEAFDLLDDDLLGRNIANAMTEAGVLEHGDQKQWYDALTGRTGEYWTLRLNEGHPEVQAIRQVVPTA